MSDNDSDLRQESQDVSMLLLDNDPAGDITRSYPNARQMASRSELLERCASDASVSPRRFAVWIWPGAIAVAAGLALLVWVSTARHSGSVAVTPVLATPVVEAPRSTMPTVTIQPVSTRHQLSPRAIVADKWLSDISPKETVAQRRQTAMHRHRNRVNPARLVEVATAARRHSPREFAIAVPVPPAEPQRLLVIVNKDTAVTTPEAAPITIVAIGPEEPSTPKGSSLTVVTEKENN